MSMPDDELSSIPVPRQMEFEKESKVKRRSDYEMGGVAVNDPSQGLLVKEWNCFVSEDLTEIWLKSVDVAPSLIYTGVNITEVSCTFDQNMRPIFSFVENGEAKLNWYDSMVEDFVVTNYGTDYKTPKVSMDDKRALADDYNDIIFAYVRDDNLYHRRQRDRYQTEFLLYTGVSSIAKEDLELQCIGMMVNKRFGFQFKNPESILDTD